MGPGLVPPRRTSAHVKYPEMWRTMRPKLDEVLAESYETFAGRGVPALNFLRGTEAHCSSSSRRWMCPPSRDVCCRTSAPLQRSSSERSIPLVKQLDCDHFIVSITAPLKDLEFNDFSAIEVQNFRTLMRQSSQSVDRRRPQSPSRRKTSAPPSSVLRSASPGWPLTTNGNTGSMGCSRRSRSGPAWASSRTSPTPGTLSGMP